jgi:conjugative transfer signal peptidase TraF
MRSLTWDARGIAFTRFAAHRGWSMALAGALSALGLGTSLVVRARPILVWNASPSSPEGLYLVMPPANPAIGETVIAWAPRGARSLAASRHYLPAEVPLVKRVAAVEGSRICALGAVIFVDGRASALRERLDPSGRPMPWWTGCRVLQQGELLVLSRWVPQAFDGRYFGVTPSTDVIGRARLLWAR